MNSNLILLHVWGERACFTRPEFAAERVSYEAMTPSAAKGVLDAIHWKPGFQWPVDRIHVLRPVRYDTERHSELKVAGRIVNNAAGIANSTAYIDARTLRQTMLLRDVAYAIEAHVELLPIRGSERNWDPLRRITKHLKMFRRRARLGQCVYQPSLGLREYVADFELVDAPPPSTLPADQSDRDLGWMLADVGYAPGGKVNPRYFYATLRRGVIDVHASPPARTDRGGYDTGAAKQRAQNDVAVVQDELCRRYFDVRAFGGVLSTGPNAGVLTGPVQITDATSIDPIEPEDMTITRVADVDKEEGEMGSKHVVPYALYRARGHVSAFLAQRTGFSDHDLLRLWSALDNMFDHDRSTARGEMAARRLIVFAHDLPIGNAPARLARAWIGLEGVPPGQPHLHGRGPPRPCVDWKRLGPDGKPIIFRGAPRARGAFRAFTRTDSPRRPRWLAVMRWPACWSRSVGAPFGVPDRPRAEGRLGMVGERGGVRLDRIAGRDQLQR